jgi:hypothetical protein
MRNAVIEAQPNGDLHVERDNCSWRRVDGEWLMLSSAGSWFPCEIQYTTTRRQVTDFECCLRSYTFEEGPDYPRGRKYGEDIGEFIRRLQIKELRDGLYNIFAPVYAGPHDPLAETRRRLAGYARTKCYPPLIPWKYTNEGAWL